MSETEGPQHNRIKMHTNPIVYVLVALFGSASWLSTNAVWMELPLLTHSLPEHWALPSYLALIVQIACIGPLVYSILTKCCGITLSAPGLIFALLLLCTISEFGLAFLWSVTMHIFGSYHSVALYLFMFILALVNSTSNVLFMPYMATFHPSYLTAYFVGMGFSSLYPSVVSLLQGSYTYECRYDPIQNATSPIFLSPRFSFEVYTVAMGCWLAMTLVSFSLLHFFHDYFANLGREPADNLEVEPKEDSPLKGTQPTETQSDTTDRSSQKRYIILSFCLAFICAQMNAVVPSVQSYATMSYSLITYHLALALSSLAHPIASFLPLWVQPKKLNQLVGLTIAATIGCTIIFIMATQSPDPIGRSTIYGNGFAIVISIVTAFLHAYARTVLTSTIREDTPQNENRLFWCGAFMQIGSFLGALIMFPLVNFSGIFTQAYLC
ncbi:unnamed protein product [Bursaphelenchus okinawaensis]|uniref:Riboflavin transporter n=1 Tax=Bursaphelenchus okinawaensis TaxID=465554 RepID=A0A811JRJ0_9BILA|nr:unnamed protein product [Bursaphelenchus okinawaensis]CAG9079674.1 unnamed protein product [Bursaphelenchus okinawaensis]